MKAEDVNLALYAEGMSLLFRSGIFQFMEGKAQVKPILSDSVNYAQLWISEGSRSSGYNSAISDLMLFKEKYLQDAAEYVPVRDYGATKSLVDRKIITKEEADELRKRLATNAEFNPGAAPAKPANGPVPTQRGSGS